MAIAWPTAGWVDGRMRLFGLVGHPRSGGWLDEANSHDAQFGTGTPGTNDPLHKPHSGYIYFPGTASNNCTIAGLANTTIYDYTVTYKDESTVDGTETSDGSGNLVLGETQTNFDDVDVKDVTVVPDGGGAEVAGIAGSAFTDPFASATGRQALTWTINRASSGLLMTVVDRPMFLYTTDDYHEIPDDAGLDFAADESFTLMVVARRASTPGDHFGWYVGKAKSNFPGSDAGYLIQQEEDAGIRVRVNDGTVGAVDQTSTPAVFVLFSVGVVRNVTDDDVEGFTDGVGTGSPDPDPTTVTIANANVMRIGASGDDPVNGFYEGQIMAVALWRSALTDTEVAEAHARLTQLPAFPPFPRRQNTLVRM